MSNDNNDQRAAVGSTGPIEPSHRRRIAIRSAQLLRGIGLALSSFIVAFVEFSEPQITCKMIRIPFDDLTVNFTVISPVTVCSDCTAQRQQQYRKHQGESGWAPKRRKCINYPCQQYDDTH